MSERILISTIMRAEGDTGVQTHFRAVANYLIKQDKSVQLVTPFNAPSWLVFPTFAVRRLINPINSEFSVWWYRHWHKVFLQMALKKILSDGKPCVIYAQCPLSADAAIRARQSKSQRVVMVVHFNISQADEWAGKGMIQDKGKSFNAIRNFETEVLPKVDKLIFVSDFMRSKLVKRIPAIKNLPSQIIPNFLSDPYNALITASPTTDLICIGTLEPRKNQSYAIEIVAEAKKMSRAITLTLVGDGVDRANLESLARDLDISHLVNFAGYVKQGAKLIRQHHACIHVAQIENLPLTLVEALAYEKPVFAAAVGGIPEVFDDGIEGRMIPLDDVDKATKLIIEWLDSTDVMKKSGIAARNRYLGSFEESIVAKQLVEFLED